jgi:hypothetical protein
MSRQGARLGGTLCGAAPRGIHAAQTPEGGTVTSAYDGVAMTEWRRITEGLVARHPLSPERIVQVVQAAWSSIFRSSVGDLKIGKDIFPQPQVLGFFLHELIPVELAREEPGWRRGSNAEKDAEYDEDISFSFEIKTSSHPRQIFGNRSYAQPAAPGTRSKSGYYLTVNFQPWAGVADGVQPLITRIRFGWLDHTDWVGQAAATGQQAHLTAAADAGKLIVLL